jgi:putative ABC transport system permease protein
MVRREGLRQFDRTGLDVIAIRRTSITSPTVNLRQPPAIDLTMVRRLARALPELGQVAPLMQRRGTIVFRSRQIQTEILGVSAGFFDLNSLNLAEGRALTDLDLNQPYVVLGRDQANSLRPGDSRPLVGRYVTINGRVLTVIGVLAPAQAIRLHSGNLNQSVLMDASTYSRVFNNAEVNVIYARHRAGEATAEVTAAAVEYLETNVEGLAVAATSAATVVAEMERQLRLFTLLLGATGSVALVLGGAGIMNSLLLAVAGRRKEIGLRRALGALRDDIQSQFLYEAIILCGAGGLIGVILGVLTTGAIALRTQWEFSLSPVVMLLGIGVAAGVGAAVGFFPAYHAARLDPVVAMRNDR